MTETNPNTFVTAESDPADFTVAEVVQHLTTASDEEAARVLALEEEGKARATLLSLAEEDAPQEAAAERLATEDPDAVAVGDALPDAGDGYDRVVVSTDGMAG